jgi:hypothetical protein
MNKVIQRVMRNHVHLRFFLEATGASPSVDAGTGICSGRAIELDEPIGRKIGARRSLMLPVTPLFIEAGEPNRPDCIERTHLFTAAVAACRANSNLESQLNATYQCSADEIDRSIVRGRVRNSLHVTFTLEFQRWRTFVANSSLSG